MPVIKTEHNKENPYFMLNKEVANDKNLSLKALGLWMKCMAKKSDWHFHVSALVKESKEGKDAIYSALNELIKAGYCVRGQKRSVKGGTFDTVEYTIYEFSVLTDKEKHESPEGLKNKVPQTGLPLTDNPPLVSNDLNKDIKKLKQKKKSKQPPPHPQPGESSGDDVSLESKTLTEKLITAIEKVNPAYEPSSVNIISKHIDAILKNSKISAQDIEGVVSYALGNSFHGSHLLKRKNFGIYLQKNFPALFQANRAKPKKERQFAPCSDDNRALAAMREMEANSI